MNLIPLAVAAYLIGSISFAVVVSRLFGLADPRTYGSKNPGATNVLRTGNRYAAALTLLGDGAKGWAVVWLTQKFGPQYGIGDGGVALAMLAVFIGHLWPLYTRFAGGKGVATALGVLLGLNVWLGLGCMLTWLAVAYLFRYSSLAALTAAGLAPLYYGLAFGTDIKALAIFIMSALLIYRHRQNIVNLMAGKESKIGAGKDKSRAEPAKPVALKAKKK